MLVYLLSMQMEGLLSFESEVIWVSTLRLFCLSVYDLTKMWQTV